MPRVVAFVSAKGGVGKTTLCANVAAQAVGRVHPERVLGVDLDPSGDLAWDLGYRGEPPDDEGAALANALLRGATPPPAPTGLCGVDVLAGGPRLRFATNVKASLASDAVGALAELLRGLSGGYGLVVVDCPPGLGAMTRLALAAADGVVIPTRADDASLAAIGALAPVWRDIRAHHNARLALLGVVLTQVPSKLRRLEVQLRDDLRTIGGGHLRVFRTVVRANLEAACGARRLGLTADEYAHGAAQHAGGTDSDARIRAARALADDYRHLTGEILNRLHSHRASTAEGARR
ncbi:MAG: ParA family protein [Acidimicrobiia bacterium]|nr:ParA family protein [Acidimicrobiia bacterium]MYC46377.1 ParA family protein [Acidimicrobiia bacterium]MYI20750.1 ParA family protein [Acidimicrobiia bacterium]